MDLSTFQQALDQDPQYQKLAQQAQASLTQKDPGQLFNSRPGQGQSSTAFMALQAYASQKAQQLGFDMNGYTAGYTGQIQQEAPTDWGRALLALTPVLGGLGAAAGGLGGGFGGGAGAADSAAPTLEGIAAGPGATTVPAGTAAGTSALGDMVPGAEFGGAAPAASSGMSSLFGGGSIFKAIDPVTAGLGIASLFGKSGPQERQGYTGPTTNAEASLSGALGNTQSLLTALKNRGPVQLRSSYVQPGPAPVSVPGLSFQIGGGLGQDPALKDPNLLIGPDFLQSLGGNPNTAVKR